MKLVKTLYAQLADLSSRATVRVAAVVTAFAMGLVEAAPSFATETPTETAVKALAEKVGSEGVALFLIIIAAIASLLAVLIAVSLGIKKLKSYVK
jgi:hypothetical protein